MGDFRSALTSFLTFDEWRTIELWEFCLIPAGCLWQLVYDPKFDLDGSLSVQVRRLGLILQIIFALAGIGDSVRCTEPHVLFIGYASGTLLIQVSLVLQWFMVRKTVHTF